MSRLISNQDAGRVDFYLYRAYDTGFVPIPCGLNLDVARAFPVSTRATDFHLDFLVPGISKCGTTSLCALLNQHPHLFIPEEKEPLFFIHSDHLDRLDGYTALFREAPPEALCGEGSTFYSSNTLEVACRDRIKRFNPDIKLIFIMRDPIDRIESSFREFHHSGPFFGVYPPFDLAKAIEKLPDILEDCRYWSRLNNYRQTFSDDRILVLLLEDLKRDPVNALKRCFSFLGVDPEAGILQPSLRLNEGEAKLKDTHLMRIVRALPIAGRRVSAWPLARQNQVGSKFGLRRPFSERIVWTPELQTRVILNLEQDIHQFLKYAERPVSIWPRFAQLAASPRVQSKRVASE